MNLLDNIVYIKKNKTEYIQFKRLLEYPELQHLYTLRQNGLNFKAYNGDGKDLEESYDKICKALNLRKTNIVKPHQTHTNKVEKVANTQQIFNEVDGLVTDENNIVLCTTSADCTSLLLFDPVKKAIANVHSGWRGTLQKIGQNAVRKMVDEYDCKAQDIICCICPHIRKCHFEVEEDVMQSFKKEFEYTKKIDEIIEKGKVINNAQKYYIDTTLINILMLEEMGLKTENIIDSGICTVCNSDKFHSYRVDKENSGRNAAIIAMQKH